MPHLKSWRENIATPARVKAEALSTKEPPTERSDHQKQEPKPSRCAKTMLENEDFAKDSCLELLKSIALAASRHNQSGLSTQGGFNWIPQRS